MRIICEELSLIVLGFQKFQISSGVIVLRSRLFRIITINEIKK